MACGGSSCGNGAHGMHGSHGAMWRGNTGWRRSKRMYVAAAQTHQAAWLCNGSSAACRAPLWPWQ